MVATVAINDRNAAKNSSISDCPPPIRVTICSSCGLPLKMSSTPLATEPMAPAKTATISVAVFAGAIGSVANGVLDIFKGNPQLEQIVTRMGGGQSLIDEFFAAFLSLMATVATIH